MAGRNVSGRLSPPGGDMRSLSLRRTSAPESTRKFTRWRRNDIDLPPCPRFHPRKPVRYQDGHRSPVVMAMSTFQKVTLATCLVLCVALLLPKMLLSRGRKDAAERPEGASPLSIYIQPLSVSISIDCFNLSSITVGVQCVFWCFKTPRVPNIIAVS